MLLGAAAAAALAAPSPAALAQAKEQFFPLLVYRTGAYAPNGIAVGQRQAGLPQADQRARRRHQRREDHLRGMRDRLRHRQRRRVLRAAEGQEPRRALFEPQSTGITFALTEKAPGDKIPLITLGYGLLGVAGRRVFKWNFPLHGHATGPAADILVQHIAKKEGGLDKLKGKKIALVYHDSRTARSRSRCCRSAPRCTASSCS